MQERWPALSYSEWRDTRDTLHLWTQIVGKVKLALNPYENHWWPVSLSVTARGLTTGPLPWNDKQRRDQQRPGKVLEVQFDFIDHKLLMLASDGASRALPLIPRSVADFYREFMECRRAPERKGVDLMTKEGYSHEVISCGFWPGGETFQEPAFYAYASPEPPGLKSAPILPSAAFYHPKLGEFLLRYDDMRTADNPEQALMDFFRSTYEAAANLSRWDRGALERPVSGAP